MLSSHDGKTWTLTSLAAQMEEDCFLPVFPISAKLRPQQELVYFCKNISYTYPNGLLGLKPISFSLFRGERIGIIGDNGSGKTTLIRILTRDIRPSQGQVVIDCLGKCGVVFQENERQLFGNTVIGELLLGVRQNEAVRRSAQAILERLSLSHRMAMHPIFLSGGEKKKLLIAAVLICQPHTLILDEPFAGMDANSIKQTIDLIEEHQQRTQMTVLVIDHNANRIPKFFERQIVIT